VVEELLYLTDFEFSIQKNLTNSELSSPGSTSATGALTANSCDYWAMEMEKEDLIL